MADLPAGRHFGTLVHDVFEAADFTAPDLDDELRRRIDAAIVRRRLDVGDPRRLVSALRGAIETPLGPAVGDVALRNVRPADRLDELTFELPLAAGAGPAGRLDPAGAARLDPAAVGRLLERTLRPDDPLYAYAERLGVPALAGALRGHLTGSIDLVLRTRDADGRTRYAVVDYKTNRLGRAGGASTLRDYEPAALTAAMHDAHYGLQGLLYVVALHRFLRWKVPDYDPAESLSGVLYLFLRGMRGADTPRVGPTPTGVFSWQPPVELVTKLSDLLDEGEGSE